MGLIHPEEGQALYNGKGKINPWASTRSLHSEGNSKN